MGTAASPLANDCRPLAVLEAVCDGLGAGEGLVAGEHVNGPIGPVPRTGHVRQRPRLHDALTAFCSTIDVVPLAVAADTLADVVAVHRLRAEHIAAQLQHGARLAAAVPAQIDDERQGVRDELHRGHQRLAGDIRLIEPAQVEITDVAGEALYAVDAEDVQDGLPAARGKLLRGRWPARQRPSQERGRPGRRGVEHTQVSIAAGISKVALSVSAKVVGSAMPLYSPAAW